MPVEKKNQQVRMGPSWNWPHLIYWEYLMFDFSACSSRFLSLGQWHFIFDRHFRIRAKAQPKMKLINAGSGLKCWRNICLSTEKGVSI